MTQDNTTVIAKQKRQNVINHEFTIDGRHKRKVRSFVLRTGRFSKHQQSAIENHWHEYGVDYQNQQFNFVELFGNENPIVLEIGFGMGTSLVTMAEQNPNTNYLGIEVHTPGVGACIATALDHNVQNLKVICHDAIEILRDCIPNNSLAGLQLFFPDPWHKTKHHKRRIVQPEFVQLILPKLIEGGFIHFATDWENYAEHMLDVLQSTRNLKNNAKDGKFIPRPENRPLTKFEERGQRLGHGVWDLYFIKTN